MELKQSGTLITNSILDSNQSISQFYKQLHKTIDQMDIKVQDVIKKHQAQFLFAYRNHIKKIKKQLSQIKQKSQDQQKMFSSNDRIQYLQKQLTIFRQQALKLYDKLQNKTQQAQIYKNKVKQLEKQSQIKQKQIKQIVKNSKLTQASKSMYQIQIKQLEEQIKLKNLEINKLTKTLGSRPTSEKVTLTDGFQIKINQNYSIQHQQSKSVRKPVRPLGLFKNTTHDSQLKQWFLQCIRTVKKQIAQRKTYVNHSPIELTSIASIDQFRMVDKLRLLELFLENQKLLVWMYQKIFPDRFTQIKGYLSQQNKKSEELQMQPQQQQNNQEDITVPKSGILPKMSDNKIKQSQVRNRVSLKNGKLNLSVY